MLESNNWDLEATAREQFDPPDASPTSQQPRLAPHDEAPEAAHYQNNIHAPIIPERNVGDNGSFQGGQQGNILPSQGSQGQSQANYASGSHSRINSPNFQIRQRPSQYSGAYGLLRQAFYLITLPIAWPVRIAFNTATNIFGFLSNILGFGHLFNFPPVGSLRGGRYLPRPPVTDPQGRFIDR